DDMGLASLDQLPALDGLPVSADLLPGLPADEEVRAEAAPALDTPVDDDQQTLLLDSVEPSARPEALPPLKSPQEGSPMIDQEIVSAPEVHEASDNPVSQADSAHSSSAHEL
ncbi:MAG: hypothetical protein KGI52_16250, partial [Burkholderiales bacterium]|nr:hypothetical protein [Burkholderiales bacterium]